jgi:hypothetical protein
MEFVVCDSSCMFGLSGGMASWRRGMFGDPHHGSAGIGQPWLAVSG